MQWVSRTFNLSKDLLIDWRPLDKLHKRPMPHFEFTEEFIIIKVLAKITIKHKTMMKFKVKSNFIIKAKLSV